MKLRRMNCLFALLSAALVSVMCSCSRPSEPAGMEPPPVQQAGEPPVRVEPADWHEPAKEKPQDLPKAELNAQKPAQRVEPQIEEQDAPKVAVDKDVPIVPPAPPKEVEQPVPMVEPAAAVVLPDVDYSLVHVAPTDVAVLIIRPAQILENPRIAEHIKQVELLGGTHPLKKNLNEMERAFKESFQMPLPPIESIQISVTRECLDSVITKDLPKKFSSPTILVQFRQHVDHEACLMKLLELQEKIPAAEKNKVSVKQHGKTKILVHSGNEGDDIGALCFLDAKTLLYGTESTVVQIIDRQGNPEASPLRDRMAPHLRKEVAFITSDIGEEILKAAKTLGSANPFIYFPFATSELFLDLNGEVVYHYRLHDKQDEPFSESDIGSIAFAYGISALAGAELGQISPVNRGRQDKVIVPQVALVPGYTVDKAAFDKRWSLVKKEISKTVSRQQFTARLVAAAKKRNDQAAVTRTAKSLNLIVEAMRRYETRHKCFPAIDSAGLDNSPRGLSWRVHLLPELGLDKLHAEFHLDEPWDSVHNQPLIGKMPAIYGADRLRNSAIHVFIGDGAPFGGARALKLVDIKDSLLYTAALIEAGPDKAEPWTKPGGIPWNHENSVLELGTIGLEVPVAFFDAGAGWIPATIPHETLSKMIGHTDGDPPRDGKLKWRHIPPGRVDVKR